MPSPSLQEFRESWINEICYDVLGALGDVGDQLPEVVRRDLGRTHLVGALLAATIEGSIAGGDPRWKIAEQVFRQRVLLPEAASEQMILLLIDKVEAAVFARGLPVGDGWDPRSGFTFLLEAWTVEQSTRVNRNVLVAQLERHWATSGPPAVPYLLGLEPNSIADHLTLTQRVEADGRELVRAIVAQGFTDERIHAQREAIMDAMHVSGIEHLRMLAVDVTTITLIGDRFQQLGAFANSNGRHELAVAAAGARFLLDEARHSTTDVLRSLSAYEVSRLFLDADQHFQTACLDAFTSRDRTTRLDDRLMSVRGTFGPLPWWRVVVTDDNRLHVEAILEDRESAISLRHDEGATLVTVHLYDPAGEYFQTFAYSLESVADCFELLLLGRSERLGIDFEERSEGGRIRLGTYSALMPTEICESLRELATSALREHLGFDEGYAAYAAVHSAAEVALFSRSARSIWSRPSNQFQTSVDKESGGQRT